MVLSRLPYLMMVLLVALAANPLQAAPLDATALAARIDERIEARLRREGMEAAQVADDAEFLRRASLDLNGRIPPAADVYEFLADDSASKRAKLIERLLLEPRFAIHFSNLWRA